jgi:hypothetical protein
MHRVWDYPLSSMAACAAWLPTKTPFSSLFHVLFSPWSFSMIGDHVSINCFLSLLCVACLLIVNCLFIYFHQCAVSSFSVICFPCIVRSRLAFHIIQATTVDSIWNSLCAPLSSLFPFLNLRQPAASMFPKSVLAGHACLVFSHRVLASDHTFSLPGASHSVSMCSAVSVSPMHSLHRPRCTRSGLSIFV